MAPNDKSRQWWNKDKGLEENKVANSSIPQCPVCHTPLSVDPKMNNGLICAFPECKARFCDNCESFYRAIREKGMPPLCKEHYAGDSVIANLPQEKAISSTKNGILAKVTEKNHFSTIAARFHESDPDKIGLEIMIGNRLEKTTRAIKGKLIFSDLFDTEIKSVGATIEITIPPGKSANWSASLDYNQFDADLRRLKTIDIEDLSTKYELEMVIFEDGSRFSP